MSATPPSPEAIPQPASAAGLRAAHGSEVRVSEVCGCKVIESPGWTMHVLKDGIRLLPPPAWLLELLELVESKTINHAAAKVVIETWQQDTRRRIGVGIEKLRNLGELK